MHDAPADDQGPLAPTSSRPSANDWRIQETAADLKIDRTYLWKLMRRLGIQPPTEEAQATRRSEPS